MADAVLLRKAAMKVVWFVVVLGVGHWLLWPDEPVREWLGTNVDWKMKFSFIGWVALALGMAYDALAAIVRGFIANPGTPSRR